MLRPPEPVAPPCPSTGHLEARVRPKFPNTGLPASKFGMLRIKESSDGSWTGFAKIPMSAWGWAARGPQAKNAGAARVKLLIAIAQQLVYLARIAAHENAAKY